jgi:Fe-S oxidoreductase
VGDRGERRESARRGSDDPDGRDAGDLIPVDPESIRKCFSSECSTCRENCPSYIAFGLESYSSRGKNRALSAYLEGALSLRDIEDLIYACTNCGQCEEVCLTGGSFSNQVLALREQLERRGDERRGLREMVGYIRKMSTPYGSKDASWIPQSTRDHRDTVQKPARSGRNFAGRGRIGYFPGCTMQADHPELARRTLTVLRRLGAEAVPISHPCCGYPALNAGFTSDAREMSRGFLEEVWELGIKSVVTSCAGCTVMLRLQLPLLTGQSVSVQHISEFLASKRKRVKEIYGSIGKDRQVLYHDPCDLARKLGVMDEPRSVIRALGSVGVSRGLINTMVEAAACLSDTGACETLVTACLNCRRMLRAAAAGDLEVLDIIELFPEDP